MTNDQISGSALAAFGLAAAVQASSYPVGSVTDPGAGFLPLVFALLLSGCGIAVAATGSAQRPSLAMFDDGRKVALVMAGLIFAAIAMDRIGYRVTLTVLLVYYTAFVERRNLLLSVAVSLLFALGSYHIFANWLAVRLPVGLYGF